MCMNIEIASIIFEICIVPEPATTSGTGLLDRDAGVARIFVWGAPGRCLPALHQSCTRLKRSRAAGSVSAPAVGRVIGGAPE